jgi:hypothetical protein
MEFDHLFSEIVGVFTPEMQDELKIVQDTALQVADAVCISVPL